MIIINIKKIPRVFNDSRIHLNIPQVMWRVKGPINRQIFVNIKSQIKRHLRPSI